MRLFIAVNFNEAIKDDLCSVIEELKKHAVKGNFTRRGHLHLTLVFLGETAKLTEAVQGMNVISAAPFSLAIEGFGRFSRPGGEIYWLGIKPNPSLNDLYQQLSTALGKAGFDIEKRPYKPHLTLGREVVLNKDFDKIAFEKTIPAMEMAVSRISLMKSERIEGKLIHQEIYTRELEIGIQK